VLSHTVEYKKARGKELWPGEWMVVFQDTEDSKVLTSCPKCGTITTLAYLEDERMMGYAHYIDYGGDVQPSVICPTCQFHIWLRLNGWVSKKEEEEHDNYNRVYWRHGDDFF
jgi:hypothetical protein